MKKYSALNSDKNGFSSIYELTSFKIVFCPHLKKYVDLDECKTLSNGIIQDSSHHTGNVQCNPNDCNIRSSLIHGYTLEELYEKLQREQDSFYNLPRGNANE